jgi:DNA primase
MEARMAKYINFAELKARVSIEQVFPMLDLVLQLKGDQWRGPCPVCDGSDRSFVVTKSKEAWYCFGCKKGGDVIAMVAHLTGVSMRDAAAAIAEGTVANFGKRSRNSSGTVPESEGKETQKLQPLAYLQPAHDAVQSLGLSEETCTHFGVGYAARGILRGRLAIPIHDLNGELVAYCGRAVKPDQKPVLTFPKGFDPSRYVFNLYRIEGGELYCTNDPLDVLLAFENGVENAIAFLHREEEDNVVRFPVPAS